MGCEPFSRAVPSWALHPSWGEWDLGSEVLVKWWVNLPFERSGFGWAFVELHGCHVFTLCLPL